MVGFSKNILAFANIIAERQAVGILDRALKVAGYKTTDGFFMPPSRDWFEIVWNRKVPSELKTRECAEKFAERIKEVLADLRDEKHLPAKKELLSAALSKISRSTEVSNVSEITCLSRCFNNEQFLRIERQLVEETECVQGGNRVTEAKGCLQKDGKDVVFYTFVTPRRHDLMLNDGSRLSLLSYDTMELESDESEVSTYPLCFASFSLNKDGKLVPDNKHADVFEMVAQSFNAPSMRM